MYQKEIIYMGLYKDGSRVGNAGFLKVENREEESRLYLKLQNIPYNIRGRFPVRIHNGNDWKEINGVSIQEGGGIWEENRLETSKGVQLQVMLPGGYFLAGKSRHAPESVSWMKGQEEEEKPENNRAPEPVPVERQPFSRVQEPVLSSGAVQETGQNSMPDERPEELSMDAVAAKADSAGSGQAVLITEELQRPAPNGRSGNTEATQTMASAPAYNLKEDKWEQILDSYEKIHPYGDERVYVKLEPKDFIILQAKYQHLVNNSFLLHGFYNYRYIILGKEQDFYLGVPGVFYEREKMVALMFGFEAFECPGGIARAGEFGYYLRKVEL